MQTIVVKYRMSTHANKSVKCAGFGRQAMPNVSCRYTVRYTICFASVDICFAQTAIADCEHARS